MRDAHDLYLLNMLCFCFAAVLCFDTQNYFKTIIISTSFLENKNKTYLIAFNKLWKDMNDMVYIEHEIGSLHSIS